MTSRYNPGVASPSNRDVVESYVRALEAQDVDAIVALLADDYTDEMPQSGERIRGSTNFRAFVAGYPGGVGTLERRRIVGSEDHWVMTPSFSAVRIEGSGDTYTCVGTITYADGQTWQTISIAEVRDGKLAKTTTWYAAPFPAPDWRAALVERFPALGE